jgi:hypothetical protein
MMAVDNILSSAQERDTSSPELMKLGDEPGSASRLNLPSSSSFEKPQDGQNSAQTVDAVNRINGNNPVSTNILLKDFRPSRKKTGMFLPFCSLYSYIL